MDKHSSLFCPTVSDEEKSFETLTPERPNHLTFKEQYQHSVKLYTQDFANHCLKPNCGQVYSTISGKPGQQVSVLICLLSLLIRNKLECLYVASFSEDIF